MTVHNLQTLDGAYLDEDDKTVDVVDDKENVSRPTIT